MIDIAEAIILALSELLMFYILGFNLPMNAKEGKTSIAENVCSGFLIYTAVFEGTAVYTTWLELSLTMFFYIWALILSGMIIFSFVFHVKSWGHRIRSFFRGLKFRPLFVLALLAFLFLAATAVIGADTDSLHTTAKMSTDLYHDSLGAYDSMTGEKLTSMTSVDLLLRWRLSGEFFSKLTGLSPAVITGITGSIVTVALFSMICYRIGWHLFGENAGTAALFLVILALSVFFFASPNSKYGSFFTAAYSGETMFGFIVIPAMILLSILIVQNERWQHLFILVFCAGISAVCLSESGWYLMPVIIPACMIPACIAGKRWKGFFFMIVSELLPAAAALFCWMIGSIPFTS